MKRFILATLFSASSFALTCPNPNDFVLHSQLPPTGYDSKTHQIKQITLSVNKELNWALIMHPVKSSLEQKDEQLVANTVAQLVPVSETSYEMSIIPGTQTINYCIYTNPQMPKLNAIAYFVDAEPGDHNNKSSILKNQNIKNLLKQLQIKN